MSSHGTFNITPKMIHLQAFSWLKQFTEGSILLDTALNSIEFTLGSNFDPDEWMELTHHIVMDRDCWPAIEKIFMQELGIVGLSSESHSQPSRVLNMSGMQGPSFSTEARVLLPSALSPSAVPLLKDPGSAWHLMMDWAQDKIGFGKLHDRMRAHGPRYIPEEWKTIIDEVFMLSDPGVESAGPTSLVVERAMKLQGITLSTASATAPSCLAPTPAAAPSSFTPIPAPSSWAPIPEVTFWGPPPVLSSDPGPYSFAPFSYPTSASEYATHRPGKSPCGATRKERRKSSGATQEKRRKSSRGTTQKKRHKLNTSIFLDIDTEDEDEEEEWAHSSSSGGGTLRKGFLPTVNQRPF
ncbi:hypothetical protein EDD15DRAFT_2365236 [Pisolithus albus]|nr:hypothetical protein EDD15DRAFT_2365236 [Pisolithus albus]